MPGAVGSFAARQTLWGRRWPHAKPGPMAPAQQGSSLPGVPLLPTFVPGYNFAALLGFGIDTTTDPSTWTLTDVSLDVQQSPGISITRGRLDEQSTTMPAQCTLTLDNRSGNYSTRRPQSTHFPYVRIGMALKIVVATAGDTFEQFAGFVDTWEPGWDTTGDYAIVNVTAHGVLQRLGQGDPPLRSALTRTVSDASPAPLAWWPMEDGPSTTVAASGLVGGTNATITGTVVFGSDGADGTGSLADFSSGGQLSATLPTISSTSYRVEFAAKFNTIASGDFVAVIDWYMKTGGIQVWEVIANANGEGGLGIQWSDNSGSSTGLYSSNIAVDDGRWHWIRVDISTSGGNQVVKVRLDDVQVINQNTGAVYGAPYLWLINPTADVNTEIPSMGELIWWAPFSGTVDTYDAFLGHSGETAVARMTRLCTENNMPLVVYGADGGRTMGPQSVATLGSLLRECEAVGGGVLEDGVNFGLRYSELESRYNQTAVMTPALTQLEPPLAPVESDQRIRNDVTATRTNGSSARYVQPVGSPYAPTGVGGVGTFEDSLPLNVDTDNVLYGRAAWKVWLGTIDADRYTPLAIDFRARTALIPAWLATVNGSRWTVPTTYATAGLPPDVLLEGWTLGLSTFVFHVAANCSPAMAYDFGVVDSSSVGRVGADDTTLAAGIGTSDVSFTVNLTYAWSAAGGDYPFDILIGGEQMTLTSVVGTTFNVTRGVGPGGFTASHNAGDAVTVYRAALVAL